MISIQQLTEAQITEETLSQLLAVIKQLSSSVTETFIRDAISSSQNHVLVAIDEENNKIVGTTTMAFLYCVTGVRAHIEDVVVDIAYRGQGIAQQLLNEAIARAKKINARSIDLTSRPDKVAANRLYQKLGFVQRDTNVYRYC